MSGEQPATGVRKRQQITNTNKQMMIYVAIAAAAVTICIVVVINLWQRIAYQLKVNGEWGTTNRSLDESIANIPKLKSNVEALSANSNIKSVQGLVDPQLEKWQVVFDVLPSSCDTLAVEYSFANKIFVPSGLGAAIKEVSASAEGYDCNNLVVKSSDGTPAPSDPNGSMHPGKVTMNISFELANADDGDIQKALLSMEYSLHPITVKSMEVTTNEDGKRSAKLSVETYFIPKARWQTGEKAVLLDDTATSSANGEAAKK